MIEDKYSFNSGNIPVNITIETKKDEFVLIYNVSISQISANTELVLDKIKDELVNKVKLGIADITDPKKIEFIKSKFKETIIYLIEKYLPAISEETRDFFTTYLMHKSFGLGSIELILNDVNLEEVVINNADEPIWVYHHKHKWLKTNITLKDEDLIKHYSSLIARKVGRSITLLRPLLDAHLDTGDRVNATLFPITAKGNTITIRKFSEKPITITDMLKDKTISLSASALIWSAIQYELSTLVSGGTASGKCLTGDSEILLSNERIKIKELVENELKKNKITKIEDGFIADCNKEVLSFNQKTLKIEKKKIDKVWKRKSPEYLIKIKTKSGKSLTCTPEHPFFILDSEIKQVRADELNNNLKIAVPKLPVEIDSDILWDPIISIEKVKSKEKWVYDLTVEDNHTFIANNMIAHNTSLLGAICGFFPPNQRIITVEDTAEIRMPKYAHWIPMITREANVEGKGEISMLDLIVNSLRMRPDRIVVGEIRKQKEAQVLFEAIHTGHSVCATVHANDSHEVITRLTNPPIDISKSLLPAISMILIMYRNRRTGIRKVLQVAEMMKDSTPNILMQYDMKQDKMLNVNQSVRLLPELETQTGLSTQEINTDLRDKAEVLKWLVKKNITDVNGFGKVIATYYTNKESLMRFIKK